MSSSMGRIIPYIMGTIKKFETTSQTKDIYHQSYETRSDFSHLDDHWAPSGQDRLDGTRLSNTNSEESRRLQRRDLLWRQGWGFDGGFLGWFIMVYGNRMVGLWESCGGFYGV